MSLIIAGIHTGIGKTVCSAILCETFGFNYFKPVQAGDLDNSDSHYISKTVSNADCVVHPESFRLNTPVSPHYAAELDGLEIKLENISLPKSDRPVLVETAGGVMSPLSNTLINLDLIEHLQLPTILVSNNYLGSINHTLCSYLALKSRSVKIKGLIFVGPKNKASEKYILDYTGLPFLFSVPLFENADRESIYEFSKNLKENFKWV